MAEQDRDFLLILNQTVRIGRRASFSTTAMGQRRPTGETEIVAALSVYFDINPKGYVWEAPGQMTKVDYVMFAAYDANLQPGDLVYPVSGVVGLTLGRVVSVGGIFDFDGLTHHVEAQVERIS